MGLHFSTPKNENFGVENAGPDVYCFLVNYKLIYRLRFYLLVSFKKFSL